MFDRHKFPKKIAPQALGYLQGIFRTVNFLYPQGNSNPRRLREREVS